MVVGNNGDRIGKGRTTQLGPASHAGPLPHPEEQSTAVDGQLH